MGVQALGAKKLRALERISGRSWDRAVVWSDGVIAEARDTNEPDHIHYRVNRRTGEVEPAPVRADGTQTHWSSCVAHEASLIRDRKSVV